MEPLKNAEFESLHGSKRLALETSLSEPSSFCLNSNV